MKSSGISSAKTAPLSPEQPSRKAFALTGPSVVLDPTTHAVRGDLADVRLAEFVFAPHYAAPMPCVVAANVTLFADRARSTGIADMTTGEPFEVLELAGGHAWGIAPERRLVGYIDRTALDRRCETPTP